MIQILMLSLRDLLSARFLKFSLLPLLVSLVIFTVLSYFAFSILLDYFNTFFSVKPDSFLAWFYALSIVQFIIHALSFLLAGFVTVFASVFFAIFIVSFLTPFIVKEINAKHYGHIIENEVSNFLVMKDLLKIFVKFIAFLLLSLLLLFLPFINLFIFYFVFYYLFHQLLLLDVASCAFSKDEYKNFWAKNSPFEFKFSTLCFYLIASVPFLGLFLPVFFVIFLTHLSYQRILNLSPKA